MSISIDGVRHGTANLFADLSCADARKPSIRARRDGDWPITEVP
jgi:hypothetical protein